MRPNLWSHLENVACAVEKNVNSAVLGLNALCISIMFIWYNVLSKASVSLLILIWMIYPFDINGVIKVPYNYCITTINFFLLCLLMFALHIKVILCWAHKYLWILYSLLGLTPLSLCIALLCHFFFFTVFILRYILSDMSDATSFLFMSTFMEKSFSHFTFSLNVSL